MWNYTIIDLISSRKQEWSRFRFAWKIVNLYENSLRVVKCLDVNTCEYFI